MAAPLILPDLRDDNPYYNGTVFVFDDGSLALDRTPVLYKKSDNDRYYTVGQGEDIDIISFEAYDNSKKWWQIADVNEIFFPFSLDIGSTLLIPDDDQLQISNL